MSAKIRADQLLVLKGYVRSRTEAKAFIIAGKVSVNSQTVLKPGTLLSEDVELELKGKKPFVSRGGEKLSGALSCFGEDPNSKVVMDIGASTGGFTDCLLQHGAVKVYAVDVGYGQLDYALRTDPRVICIERKNARYLEKNDIGESVDLITIDVSFISLTKILPAMLPLLKEGAKVIALVKPQFEVGQEHVGKGGVVREEHRRLEALSHIRDFALSIGMTVLGDMVSPLQGPAGNFEYFLYLEKKTVS
ncbi:MAG: TlyA family RNA methyltransferase [Chlamydiota bacterium]|nr:TlyA family RNA methyltransferase [Chlamydiota bacterium]